MPSTIGGLLLFVVFLIPGFVYYIQRRRKVELRAESSLVETARLVSVSVVTNLLTLCVFALVRLIWRTHTPNPEQLLDLGWAYVRPRPGYLLAWTVALMSFSTALAFTLSWFSQSHSVKWFAPDIVNTSAWNRYFSDGTVVPEGTTPFVGLDLRDGRYISGFVDWFSTELDEVEDRDLVLARPIKLYSDENQEGEDVGFPRLVVSAREIKRIYVSYEQYPKALLPAEVDGANSHRWLVPWAMLTLVGIAAMAAAVIGSLNA